MGASALLAVLFIVGCATGPEIPSGPVVNTHDQAIREKSASGLDLKLLTFEWVYHKPTDQIKVNGWVQNQSDSGVQACRIMVQAFDQFNYSLGAAETYLDPTYVPPGGKARFDFFLHRGVWVENLVLNYRFETNY